MNRLSAFFLLLCLSVLLRAQPVVADGSLRSAPTDSVTPALPWPLNVQARIDTLLGTDLFQTSQVGLMVYDLTADSALYRHNERQLLRPASTMKLLTAVTALDVLGSSHRYATRLYYCGTITDGTLHGDLYCVGGFDPLLDAEDVRALALNVRQAGIEAIEGRIVADLSMKDDQPYGEGWCWDDDNPLLTPLSVGSKDVFMQEFIKELFASGVMLDGMQLAVGRMPAGGRLIGERWHTIGQVLQPMMKESDNFMAEATFYQVAASGGHRPATAEDGRAAIRRLVGRTGMGDLPCKVADGSGLSLYNYVSAEVEIMVLRYAWRNRSVFEPLYSSLPIAGIDGTLKKRMTNTAAMGNVHAKTGTVTAISSLAGYCRAANGHLLCFAIINQGLLQSSRGRQFQDLVCTALCEP